MEKINAPRAVDLVANRLREAVLSGEFPPGAFLPPERELSVTLGVSRLTLRAAVSRLEAEGLLRARQGSGVVVLDYRTEAGVELLTYLLADGDIALLRPLLQLRRAIAVEAMAVACAQATDEDIARLSALAEELAQSEDLDRLAEGNLDFVRAVIRLADNLPLELLFNTVVRVFRTRPELSAAMLADPDAVRASFPFIVGLIRSREADRARTLVRGALEAIDTATLAALEIA
ncbi:MAG: FadR family transcriptional regulator [Deltaproteobacteria bacterium]|nr:FadR family transcriptional regulator [Deltaproteobacteria bacterium]